MENHVIYYGHDDGSIHTKIGKDKLWKEESIIYVDGVHAFEVVRRDNMSPLVRLYTEDDECLCSTDIIFDYSWLNSLRRLINVTQDKIGKLENEDKL